MASQLMPTMEHSNQAHYTTRASLHVERRSRFSRNTSLYWQLHSYHYPYPYHKHSPASSQKL